MNALPLKMQVQEPEPPKLEPIDKSTKTAHFAGGINNQALAIPVYFSPSLAALIGINEAIFIQKLHYWTAEEVFKGKDYGRDFNGCRYIFNSLEEWRQQLPFMSTRELQNTLKNLDEFGLLFRSPKQSRRGYTSACWLLDIPGEDLDPEYPEIMHKLALSESRYIINTTHSDKVMTLNILDIQKFGMAAAIVLADIKYQTLWAGRHKKPDGYVWYRASLNTLTANLHGCMSTPTIDRALRKLRQLGVLAVTTKHNTIQREDRTLSYRVNIPELEKIFEGLPYEVAFHPTRKKQK